MALSLSTKLNIIVAACNNRGIGIEGGLPWRLKKDMAFFKKITSTTQAEGKKNVVIMGKNTWLSIPPRFRPLSDRINVVLSTQLQENLPGVFIVRSFEEALDMVGSMQNQVDSVFVIGGASVYKEAMMRQNPCRIYFTKIHSDFLCDTFFPSIDEDAFTRVSNTNQNVPTETFEENGIKFSFEVYEKI